MTTTDQPQEAFMAVVCSKDGKLKTIDVKRGACFPPKNLYNFDWGSVKMPIDAIERYRATARDSSKWHDVRIKFSNGEWKFDATVKSFKETEDNMLRIVFAFDGIIEYSGCVK